jgi:hypothetical protein
MAALEESEKAQMRLAYLSHLTGTLGFKGLLVNRNGWLGDLIPEEGSQELHEVLRCSSRMIIEGFLVHYGKF